jgi:hypothetical protein
MTEVDETHICIACTIIQEELKSSENVSKNLATEIPHRDDEKSQEKALPKLASSTTKLPTNPKPTPKPRTPKTKQHNLDDPRKLNLSELRTREIKVKKVEEQLKVKDKSLLEIRNEKIVLETRCQQLESRNFELEQTVKLLKRRLESDNHLAAPPTHNTCKPPTNSGCFAPNPVRPVSRFALFPFTPGRFAPGRFAPIPFRPESLRPHLLIVL